jgi:His/Glu/Gln/Arg/opine family amino acid ABC transporter permease subunit
MSDGYVLTWRVIAQYQGWLIDGFKLTIYLSAIGFVMSAAWGLMIALFRMVRFMPFMIIGRAYVEFFRGIPLFVLLIWFYYGISMFLGIVFTPFFAGLLCLTLLHGAYMAEIYRAGIQGIPKGQSEASLSLGLSSLQTMRLVILPQAIRLVIPPGVNEFVNVLKSSTLLAIIGVYEFFRASQIAVSHSFRAFEFYTVSALVYVLISVVFSIAMGFLEMRNKRSV